MLARFRARFKKGHIEPREPVEFPEGADLVVTAEEVVETGTEPAEQVDIFADYDPEKVREALRESAGALKGVDREQFLKEIYEARTQESRGRPA